MLSLTADQVDAYKNTGYLVVPDVLSADEIAELRQITDEYSERARTGDHDLRVMDLGTRDGQPYLRRIKSPHRHHPVYDKTMRHPRILDIVADLIGQDIRIYGTKLNLKLPSGTGDAIEWHQDWAFYPHTNEDLVAVGVMVDDMTLENGPLLVSPGSHKGEVYSHHYDGHFVGALDPKLIEQDIPKCATLTGKAGTITLHHPRAVHASGPNRSSGPRRVLFQNYSAADAWPLVGCGAPGDRNFCAGADFHAYENLIVAGQHREMRMEKLPVILPLPGPPDSSSVYTTQSKIGRRYFD